MSLTFCFNCIIILQERIQTVVVTLIALIVIGIGALRIAPTKPQLKNVKCYHADSASENALKDEVIKLAINLWLISNFKLTQQFAVTVTEKPPSRPEHIYGIDVSWTL